MNKLIAGLSGSETTTMKSTLMRLAATTVVLSGIFGHDYVRDLAMTAKKETVLLIEDALPIPTRISRAEIQLGRQSQALANFNADTLIQRKKLGELAAEVATLTSCHADTCAKSARIKQALDCGGSVTVDHIELTRDLVLADFVSITRTQQAEATKLASARKDYEKLSSLVAAMEKAAAHRRQELDDRRKAIADLKTRQRFNDLGASLDSLPAIQDDGWKAQIETIEHDITKNEALHTILQDSKASSLEHQALNGTWDSDVSLSLVSPPSAPTSSPPTVK